MIRDGIISGTAHPYMIVEGTVKIVTSKMYHDIIEYAVTWCNSRGEDEVYIIKTPLEDHTIKNIGTMWNINGELRTKIYKDKVFKEERRTSFFIWVDSRGWMAEYNPDKLLEDTPF